MEILAWVLIILCFIIAFVGLVYPIIPSVLFILGGYIIYGLFFGFSELSWWFWLIELLIIGMLFAADAISNMIGVKAFGGSKAGIWGSTIGLIFGPFVLPFAGIILGPFLGALIAELLVEKQTFSGALKAGFGSLVGFLTSVVTKGTIQIILILIFIVAIIW